MLWICGPLNANGNLTTFGHCWIVLNRIDQYYVSVWTLGSRWSRKRTSGSLSTLPLEQLLTRLLCFWVVLCPLPSFFLHQAIWFCSPCPAFRCSTKCSMTILGLMIRRESRSWVWFPQSTMQEFFLPLETFNLGADTKNGCRVWANNHMFQGKIWRVLNNTHGDPNGLMPFNNIKINQVAQSMSWCLLPCSLSAKFTDCPAHWWVPTRWIPSGSWSSGSQIPSCRWHPDNSPRKCGNKWWIWEDHAHGWNLRIGHQLRCFA